MNGEAIGLICARGGSKGILRKNLRKLGDKPLIGWAIEVARKCPSLSRVIVSTEDQEIAAVAQEFGAEIPFLRPAHLAQDDSPELLTWQHCLETLSTMDGKMPHVLVNIPATSPLRSVEDVEKCVAAMIDKDADLSLTVRQTHANPYFNMVAMENGWAKIAVTPPTPLFRRQDAPAIYEVTTVAYAARATYILQTSELLSGKVTAIVVPTERAVDIDTELDFAFAEFLLEREQGLVALRDNRICP
jgi:N-acylneuraminate cytidylyltransferase